MSEKRNKKKAGAKKSRRERMSRKERMDDARQWIDQYEGRVLVQKYKKRYGLSTILTAVDELLKLEVELDEEYVARIKRSVSNNVKSTISKKSEDNPVNEAEKASNEAAEELVGKIFKKKEKVEKRPEGDKPFRNKLY